MQIIYLMYLIVYLINLLAELFVIYLFIFAKQRNNYAFSLVSMLTLSDLVMTLSGIVFPIILIFNNNFNL